MTENVVVNIVASRLSEQRLTAMPNTTAQYVLHIWNDLVLCNIQQQSKKGTLKSRKQKTEG